LAKEIATSPPKAKVGLFQMMRDVFLASIAKGQFPIAIFGCALIIMVFRMPPEDLTKLAFRLVEAAERRATFGYVLFVLTLGLWFVHSRFQRRKYGDEVARVSHERNECQKKLLGNKVKSSEE
jgi:hypothetical protein